MCLSEHAIDAGGERGTSMANWAIAAVSDSRRDLYKAHTILTVALYSARASLSLCWTNIASPLAIRSSSETLRPDKRRACVAGRLLPKTLSRIGPRHSVHVSGCQAVNDLIGHSDTTQAAARERTQGKSSGRTDGAGDEQIRQRSTKKGEGAHRGKEEEPITSFVLGVYWLSNSVVFRSRLG